MTHSAIGCQCLGINAAHKSVRPLAGQDRSLRMVFLHRSVAMSIVPRSHRVGKTGTADLELQIMARVTVEDCIVKLPNRFELVMLAAQRARDIGAGASLTLDRDNDKNPVVALREIADGTITIGHLKDALVRDRQRVAQEEEPDDEVIELMAGEEELYAQASADTLAEDMEVVDVTGDQTGEVSAAELASGGDETEDPASLVVDDGTDISADDVFSSLDDGKA